MFYVTTHPTHFIYGYIASDISYKTNTCSTLRLAARVPLYALSHKQHSTYRDLCYTSRGAQAGTTHNTRCGRSTTELRLSQNKMK